MPIRTWLAIGALGAAACAAPATSTMPANRSGPAPAAKTASVTLRPYGVITIEDGAIRLMDHNNGDGRVHVMTVSRDFRGSKLSWADRAGPRTDVRTDTFPISADERDQIRSWSEQLWRLAPNGRRSFPRPPPDGTAAYEWAIVMRRGDQVRVIEGGTSSEPDEVTQVIESAVDFLDMHF